MRWSIVFTTYVSEQGCQLYSMVRVFLATCRQGFAVMFEMSCDKLSNLRRKGTLSTRISCRQPRQKGLCDIVAVSSCLRGSLGPLSSGNVRSLCLPGEGAPEDRVGWSHKVTREQQSSPRERAKKMGRWHAAIGPTTAPRRTPGGARRRHDRSGGGEPWRSILAQVGVRRMIHGLDDRKTGTTRSADNRLLRSANDACSLLPVFYSNCVVCQAHQNWANINRSHHLDDLAACRHVR